MSVAQISNRQTEILHIFVKVKNHASRFQAETLWETYMKEMQAELRIRPFLHHVSLFVCKTVNNQPELEIQTAVFTLHS